jgi:hypothetical protein
MDGQLEKRISFLRRAGTEAMPHSGRALLDHLLGTRNLLIEWEARPALCDAGLFHSVYGTQYYELKAIPVSMRDEVRQLIGDEAELLAWLFCMMRREALGQNLERNGNLRVQHRLTDEWLPLTRVHFQDLMTMTFANSLEAVPRASWIDRRNRPATTPTSTDNNENTNGRKGVSCSASLLSMSVVVGLVRG